MKTLREALEPLLRKPGPTLYDACLDVGLEYSNTKKILYKERKTTFEKRLEVLERVCKTTVVDLDFGSLSAALAQEHLPDETIKQLIAQAEAARKNKG